MSLHPCTRAAVAAWVLLATTQTTRAANITISKWDNKDELSCDGPRVGMESYISGVCYQAREPPPPPGPPLPPGPDPERPLWFKLSCRGVLTQEVVRELYTEPECRIIFRREVHEAGVCLIELDNSIFVANVRICLSNLHPSCAPNLQSFTTSDPFLCRLCLTAASSSSSGMKKYQ